MFKQMPEQIIFEDKTYEIVAYEDHIIFDAHDYGLEPEPCTLKCLRGYWGEYVVKDGKLVMERLYLHAEDGNYPELNGVSASIEGAKFGHRSYEVNMEMDYSGKFMLGERYMSGHCAYIGEHSMWAYETLKEIEFENGKLVGITDLSEDAESHRKDEVLFKEKRDTLFEAFIEWVMEHGEKHLDSEEDDDDCEAVCEQDDITSRQHHRTNSHSNPFVS